MTTTQFAMVEELASLIKDNLHSKHLVLSVEEALVNFLQDDTSMERVLELQPMSPYHRLLLHRLADIYGFSHESVGEGDDRHLVLEWCPEAAIPSILVSDILWQHDGYESPNPTHHILKRNEASELKQAETLPSSTTFEEREAAYIAARERIFSQHESEEKEFTVPKSRNIPVTARRMIAHALGTRIGTSNKRGEENVVASSSDYSKESTVNQHLHGNKAFERKGDNNLEREQRGAAKRIFAQALGLSSSKGNQGTPMKSTQGSKSSPIDL